jgi:hypothetical protein
MSAPINSGGGPAFPTLFIEPEYGSGYKGMTLRDYFAAAALKGQAHRLCSPYEHRDILAADCYAIADAMLAARQEVTK